MSSVTTKRVSLTIPIDVLTEIDYCSHRLGITRSAFMSELMRQSLSPILPLLQSLPDSPDEVAVKRFRGDSVAVIQSILGDAFPDIKGAVDEQRDLFKD
jgi:hypothetical protein